jgi:hypothetical protein
MQLKKPDLFIMKEECNYSKIRTKVKRRKKMKVLMTILKKLLKKRKHQYHFKDYHKRKMKLSLQNQILRWRQR